MPKIHSLLAWLLILPMAAGAVEYVAPDEEVPPGDPEMLKMHNHLVDVVAQDARTPPLDIYFLGDSITEFWPYPHLDGVELVNRGIAGQNSSQMLLRFEDDVANFAGTWCTPIERPFHKRRCVRSTCAASRRRFRACCRWQ